MSKCSAVADDDVTVDVSSAGASPNAMRIITAVVARKRTMADELVTRCKYGPRDTTTGQAEGDAADEDEGSLVLEGRAEGDTDDDDDNEGSRDRDAGAVGDNVVDRVVEGVLEPDRDNDATLDGVLDELNVHDVVAAAVLDFVCDRVEDDVFVCVADRDDAFVCDLVLDAVRDPLGGRDAVAEADSVPGDPVTDADFLGDVDAAVEREVETAGDSDAESASAAKATAFFCTRRSPVPVRVVDGRTSCADKSPESVRTVGTWEST